MTTIRLVCLSPPVVTTFVFACNGNVKVYSPSKFQVYNTVLLTTVTMLCIRSPELSCFLTGDLYSLTTFTQFPPTPAPGGYQATPGSYEFVTSELLNPQFSLFTLWLFLIPLRIPLEPSSSHILYLHVLFVKRKSRKIQHFPVQTLETTVVNSWIKSTNSNVNKEEESDRSTFQCRQNLELFWFNTLSSKIILMLISITIAS